LTAALLQMVNAEFPPPAPYGFELVDTPDGAASGIRINRKFTSRPIRENLVQIFDELSSMQSLAIYRELLGQLPRGRRCRI
jgi:hypothetical protein